MRALWAGTLGLSVGLLAAAARGDEIQWRPSSRRAAAPLTPTPLPPGERGTSLDRPQPSATLGMPVPLKDAVTGANPPGDGNISPTSYFPAAAAPYTARGQAPDPSGPTLAPPAGLHAVPAAPEERYNCGIVSDAPAAGGSGFFGKCKSWFGNIQFGGKTADRCLFQSVHTPEMDQFASPVSDPFLFEDPRTLTEARPIFIFQQTPGSQYAFQGGNIEYFGVQGRLAVTERLSLVVNKFGGIWQQPRDNILGFGHESAFAEIRLGPKYTFFRCDETRTVAAAGLTFQVPVGSASMFQNTGNLSLVPYVSAAQNFLRSSWGSFNVMDTFGYSFATDNKRTEYIYNALHLDYNVANLNKIYPLLELSYLNYTRAGTNVPFGFEGRDLINYGSEGVSGRNSLVLAGGARYKFNECIQTGLAVGTPIIAPRDLYGWRLTFDLIFRY